MAIDRPVQGILGGIVLLIALLIAATPALAQNFGGAFSGMSDSSQPIQIEADKLEVADKHGTATFWGNVKVVQGSTILRASSLKVYYFQDGSGSNGKVKRIEAGGRVAVRSEDQRASSDKAIFDMQSEIVTMTGNVTVSQGQNVATGCKLLVYLKTSTTEFTPCKKKGGRVKILLTPKS